MTVIENVPLADNVPLAKVRRFTRDEYYRMAEDGFFVKQRVELINGEILIMAPQNNPHGYTIAILNRLLVRALPDHYILRPQLPLSVADDSEPEPDIAIVVDEPGVNRGEHPCTARLVIEVADSSLRLDRAKANLYASAAVPEYWIVDLQTKALHVYRHPVTDRTATFGARYTETRTLDSSNTISPLDISVGDLQVAQLFPNF